MSSLESGNILRLELGTNRFECFLKPNQKIFSLSSLTIRKAQVSEGDDTCYLLIFRFLLVLDIKKVALEVELAKLL